MELILLRRYTVIKMRKFSIVLCSLFLLGSFIGNGNAVLISPLNITATGPFNHDKALITDGTIPAEKTGWSSGQSVWWQKTTSSFVIDFGQLFTVEDILVSVDNNDYYNIDYSVNGEKWFTLLFIDKSFGNVTQTQGGMDTMTTIAGNSDYVPSMDFSTGILAQYLKIYATGGDNHYSVGELQAFGSSAEVPEPTTMILFGAGMVGIVAVVRRKRNK